MRHKFLVYGLITAILFTSVPLPVRAAENMPGEVAEEITDFDGSYDEAEEDEDSVSEEDLGEDTAEDSEYEEDKNPSESDGEKASDTENADSEEMDPSESESEDSENPDEADISDSESENSETQDSQADDSNLTSDDAQGTEDSQAEDYLAEDDPAEEGLTEETFTENRDSAVTPEDLSYTQSGNVYSFTSDSYNFDITVTTSCSRILAYFADKNSTQNYKLLINVKDMDGEIVAKSEKNFLNNIQNMYFRDLSPNTSYTLELEVQDQKKNTLASFTGKGLRVKTLADNKKGFLYKIEPEYSSISVFQEVLKETYGYIRYRKSADTAAEWTYYNTLLDSSKYEEIILQNGIEPSTQYTVQLVSRDGEEIYDTREVTTLKFPGTIRAEVSDNGDVIVTLSDYTGKRPALCAKISYVNAVGATEEIESTFKIENGTAATTFSFNNLLDGKETKLNITAGEKKELTAGGFTYSAWSDTLDYTYHSSIPEELRNNIKATISPTESGNKTKIDIMIENVTDSDQLKSTFNASVYYKLKSEKNYDTYAYTYVYLTRYNGNSQYHSHATISGLIPGEMYDFLIIVDGISRNLEYTVPSLSGEDQKVKAEITMKRLMQGISVSASLKSDGEMPEEKYYVDASVWDEKNNTWRNLNCSYFGTNPRILTAENQYKVDSLVFYSEVYVNLAASNRFRVTIHKGTSQSDPVIACKTATLKPISLKTEFMFKSIEMDYVSLEFTIIPEGDGSLYSKAALYIRESGSQTWFSACPDDFWLINSNYTYIRNLKPDTEYDLRLVSYAPDRPELYKKEKAFRTKKEIRNVHITPIDIKDTTATLRYDYESGSTNGYGAYVYIFYKKKNGTYQLYEIPSHKSSSSSSNITLKDLNPGTTYEVLIECKDRNDTTTPGEDAIYSSSIEFTTKILDDYRITLEIPEDGIGDVFADAKLKLTKDSGVLNSVYELYIVASPIGSGKDIPAKVQLEKSAGWERVFTFQNLTPDSRYVINQVILYGENGTILKTFSVNEAFQTKKYPEAQSVTIQNENIRLNAGQTVALKTLCKPESIEGFVTYRSDSPLVATVSNIGTITAWESGEATVYAEYRKGENLVDDHVTVTVKDYQIKIKRGNDHSTPSSMTLTSGTEQQFAVIDQDSGEELPDVAWSVTNSASGTITGEGLFTATGCGSVMVKAQTKDGITLTAPEISVLNKIEGMVLFMGAGESDEIYQPIEGTAGYDYVIAEDTEYIIYALASPGKTSSFDLVNSLYTLDDGGKGYITADHFMRVPKGYTGDITITGTLKENGAVSKLKIKVVEKPSLTELPQTYLWVNHDTTLKNAALPNGWKWKEEDTVVNAIVDRSYMKYTAVPSAKDVYPLEQKVSVNFLTFDASEWQLSEDWDSIMNEKGIFGLTGKTLNVSLKLPSDSKTSVLYGEGKLSASGKNKKNIAIEKKDEKTFQITASKNGECKLTYTCPLYTAAFDENGNLTNGKVLETYTVSRNFYSDASLPAGSMAFAYDDSEIEANEMQRMENNLVYSITSDQMAKDNKTKNLTVTVRLKDINGNFLPDASLKVTSSDSGIAAATLVKKTEEDKNITARIKITIKKKDGTALIKVTSADPNQASDTISVQIRNYAPYLIESHNAKLNAANIGDSAALAMVYVPYLGDTYTYFYLVKEKGKGTGLANQVKGLAISNPLGSDSGYEKHFAITVRPKINEDVEKTGTISCYLAVKAYNYSDIVYLPVKITVRKAVPKITIKQVGANNLFYKDTKGQSNPAADKIAGNLQIRISDENSFTYVRKVVWRPGVKASEAEDDPKEAKNTQFLINRNTPVTDYSSFAGITDLTTLFNMYYNNFIIDTNYPVLDKGNKPAKDAVSGTLYIYLMGYEQPFKKDFTIKTTYKKPKLKVGTFTRTMGQDYTDKQIIYTNAYGTSNQPLYNSLSSGNIGASYDLIWASEDGIKVSAFSSNVSLNENDGKDRKVTLNLYSPYWNEPLTVSSKIKTEKFKGYLNPAELMLNASYPSEASRSAASTYLMDKEGRAITYSRLDIIPQGSAKKLVESGLINIYGCHSTSSAPYERIEVSLNNGKAMKKTIKNGTYKFKLHMSNADGSWDYGTYTLSVKVVNTKEDVKIRTKGKINLLRLDYSGTGYGTSSSVEVIPTFTGTVKYAKIQNVSLTGEYADYFEITSRQPDGRFLIRPKMIGKLKANKTYKLTVNYEFSKSYSSNGKNLLLKRSITVKPICAASKPKFQTVNLFLSGTRSCSLSHYSDYINNDYNASYRVENISGGLDIDKDGRDDITIKNDGGYAIFALSDTSAAAAGKTYKVPMKVAYVGNDGQNGIYTYYVNVKVRK